VRKVIARHRYVAAVIGLLLIIILSFSFVSFDLYISAKKAQRDAENIAEEWSQRVTELEEEGVELTLEKYASFDYRVSDKTSRFF
jgi:uncharacterized protein YpmB